MKVMTGYKFLVVAFFLGLGVVFSIILLYLHREIYFLRTENPKQGSLLVSLAGLILIRDL